MIKQLLECFTHIYIKCRAKCNCGTCCASECMAEEGMAPLSKQSSTQSSKPKKAE